MNWYYLFKKGAHRPNGAAFSCYTFTFVQEQKADPSLCEPLYTNRECFSLFYIKKCLENVGHGGESDVDVK